MKQYNKVMEFCTDKISIFRVLTSLDKKNFKYRISNHKPYLLEKEKVFLFVWFDA